MKDLLVTIFKNVIPIQVEKRKWNQVIRIIKTSS